MKTTPPRLLVYPILIIGLLLNACTSMATEVATFTPTLTPSPTRTQLPPTITPTAAPTLAHFSDPMKGIVYFPAAWGGDSRPEVEWALQNLFIPTGANWIRLHLECQQETARSTQVTCDESMSISDEIYVQLVKSAHQMGLRVMSEQIIYVANDPEGHWAGDIGKFYTEEKWAEWFESFGTMILHYAELAEKADTDYLVIGSELESTTLRTTEWLDLIQKVRQVYHGRITIALDQKEFLQQAQFWGALDSIGVHPYFMYLPGVQDPSVEQLKQAFAPDAKFLEDLSAKWGKPILITELGVWSVDKYTQDYNYIDQSNQVDLQEQTNYYQAIFETFWGRDWVQGIFCYAIEGGSNYAEPLNIHNDFIRKPAENVIRSFFGAPPFPTPTAVVPPPAEFINIEMIYDNQVNPNWIPNPPFGDPNAGDFDQNVIAVNGNAVMITLPTWQALDFRNDSVDWSKYQWLDFDIYLDAPANTIPLDLTVTLRDTGYQGSPFRVELSNSQFIDGGKQKIGVWQHVQIPLDVFGPLLSHYGIISISNWRTDPIVIYVDNLQLRGR